MDFPGKRLKFFRKQKNMTQGGLGACVGIGQVGISNIERGDSEISESILIILEMKFSLSRDWLLKGTEPMYGASCGDEPEPKELQVYEGEYEGGAVNERSPLKQVPDAKEEALPDFEDMGLDQMIYFLQKEWYSGDAFKRGWLYEQLRRNFPEFEKMRPDASGVQWPTKEKLEQLKQLRDKAGKDEEEKNVA